MERTVLSHHFSGRRNPSLLIRDPALYIACLDAPKGALVLLEAIVPICLKDRIFSPGQAKLGVMMHRSPRTIIRYVKVLRERGWLRVIRRGKKLTNIYRLGRTLWRRLTGRVASRAPRELQDVLYRLGLRFGVSPSRMVGAGVGPP
jgi:hypothetical protein